MSGNETRDLRCDAFVHGANLQHRICGAPATGVHHGIGGDQPRCDRHSVPGMSVEGVPSVDDVAARMPWGNVRLEDVGKAAEAVHALYAPHLAGVARTEYRVLALSQGSYEPCIISHVGADIFESRGYAEKLAAEVREKGWADRVWVEERRAREVGDWAALAEPKEQA